ncbi:MAG: hypothetical protein ACO3KD_06800 [Gaiellales bacterium]
MPALVATPVAQYATTTSWIAAPAVGRGDLAWLEVKRADGSARTVAAFRGDRLVLRAAGTTRTIVHEDCDPGDCDIVRAPVAGADGAFAYSVAFPGVAGYVASVTRSGASNVVAEDISDPELIRDPHLVATTAAAVVWVEDGSIRIAPAVGGTAAILVAAEATGGEVTAISAGPAGIAWSVRRPDGGTAIVVRTITGEVAVRAEESAGSKQLAQPVLMDDGVVVALSRRIVRGRYAVDLIAIAADGARRTIAASTPFGRGGALEAMRPSVSGTRVAARLREGAGGRRDAIWVFDLASGARQRVTAAERRRERLSDPSFGGGRLVWAKTQLRGSRLVRARILSAAVRG